MLQWWFLKFCVIWVPSAIVKGTIVSPGLKICLCAHSPSCFWKSNALEFITIAFCSGVYHRAGGKNDKKAALKRPFIINVCLFALDIEGKRTHILNYSPSISQLSPGWWMSIFYKKENSAEQHWTSICNAGPKHRTASSNWDCMHWPTSSSSSWVSLLPPHVRSEVHWSWTAFL